MRKDIKMIMKWLASRLFLVCGLVTVATLAVLGAQQQNSKEQKPTFSADSRPGCRKASWEPEVFSFYGDPAAVTAKLKNFEMNLPDRRVFLFMIESTNAAQVSLFELAKESKGGDTFHVWSWKGQSASDLREKATETILANRGVLCVGEQIKGLVKVLNPEDKGEIPAPRTALAAFGHEIHGYNNQYIRLTVFLLC
jgi:hypothetical protein